MACLALFGIAAISPINAMLAKVIATTILIVPATWSAELTIVRTIIHMLQAIGVPVPIAVLVSRKVILYFTTQKKYFLMLK